MQPVLNVEDIKRVEVSLTRVGVSVSELMHRAGYAAAQEVLNLGGSIDNVVILAGMGNNGGDGWVAAEALRSRNVNVKVITPIAPDGTACGSLWSIGAGRTSENRACRLAFNN